MSIIDEILNRTDLDDKALAALKDADQWLNRRRTNIRFVWTKFRPAAAILIAGGFVAGAAVTALVTLIM